MRVTNLGPAAAGDAAAVEDDEPELPEPLGLVPGAGGSGVDAPSSNNLTVPATSGRGPSLGFSRKCRVLLNSSATSSSCLLSMPMLQSKLRNPPLPAAPRNLRSWICGT